VAAELVGPDESDVLDSRLGLSAAETRGEEGEQVGLRKSFAHCLTCPEKC
jgi:hypothetical protein